MDKPEQRMWGVVAGGMAGMWHAQRHEDRYSTDIPDLSFGIGGCSEGWMEFKCLDKYPSGTAKTQKSWDFSADYFTVGQRNWLSERSRRGTGRCFLLAKMGKLWVIWHWKKLETLLGAVPWCDIEAAASGIWLNVPNWIEFTAVIRDLKKLPARFQLMGLDKPVNPVVKLVRRIPTNRE